MNPRIMMARIEQQQQQVSAILAQRIQPSAIVASAPTRDPADGTYLLTAGDGGTIRQQYISSSAPASVPPAIIPSSTIGLPGYFTQVPAR